MNEDSSVEVGRVREILEKVKGLRIEDIDWIIESGIDTREKLFNSTKEDLLKIKNFDEDWADKVLWVSMTARSSELIGKSGTVPPGSGAFYPFRYEQRIQCPGCGHDYVFERIFQGPLAKDLGATCPACSYLKVIPQWEVNNQISGGKVPGKYRFLRDRKLDADGERHVRRYYHDTSRILPLRRYPTAPEIGLICLTLSILCHLLSAWAGWGGNGELAGGLAVIGWVLLLYSFYMLIFGIFQSIERINLVLIEGFRSLNNTMDERERKDEKE